MVFLTNLLEKEPTGTMVLVFGALSYCLMLIVAIASAISIGGAKHEGGEEIISDAPQWHRLRLASYHLALWASLGGLFPVLAIVALQFLGHYGRSLGQGSSVTDSFTTYLGLAAMSAPFTWPLWWLCMAIAAVLGSRAARLRGRFQTGVSA